MKQLYTHQLQYQTIHDTFVFDTSVYVYRPHLRFLLFSVGGKTLTAGQKREIEIEQIYLLFTKQPYIDYFTKCY